MPTPTEVVVDAISALERSLTIVVPVDQIEEKTAEEFKKLAQSVQIKGYRKGKVPLPLLKQRYSKSVHDEVVRKMMDQHLADALKNNELHPVGKIQIDTLEAEEGQPLKIKATFEVSPDIQLMDIAQLSLEKLQAPIPEEEVERKIEELRKRQAIWNPTQTPAEKGNQVKIDYEGTVEGKTFPGGSNQGMTLEIGKETMIEGFENQLVGAKAGDHLEFDVTFPEDYGIKELEGQKAHFKVKVHEVLTAQLPELDDNFAKKLDIQGGIEALKKKLKEFMEEELNQLVHENLKYQIIEKLIEKHPFELPKSLIEAEIKAMQERVKQQFSHMMQSASFPELSREYFEKQASKKVATGLIFSELVKQYGITPDQQRLQKKIQEMTSAYGTNSEMLMKWLASHEEARQQLTFAVLEDQVIDKIIESAQIKDKVVSYREVIQWKPEEA